jgi:hypothetical protein
MHIFGLLFSMTLKMEVTRTSERRLPFNGPQKMEVFITAAVRISYPNVSIFSPKDLIEKKTKESLELIYATFKLKLVVLNYRTTLKHLFN